MSSVVPRDGVVPATAKLIVPPLERAASEVKLRVVLKAAARFSVMVPSPPAAARAPRAWVLATVAPVLSVVKPAVPPKVKACEASVPVPPRDSWTVPWLMLRPPEKVLAPESVRLPAPVLVTAKEPETMPESVRVLASTWTVFAAGSATAPETVRLLVPRKRRFWVSVSALAAVRPATAASSEPPLRVIAPEPAPVVEPRERVPALIETPEKVLVALAE